MDTQATGAAVQAAPAKWVGTSRTARLSERWRKALLAIVPLIVLMGVWAAIAAVMDRPRIFPSLLAIWEEFVKILRGENPLGSSYMHIQTTIVRLLIAFILSFLLGTVIGMVAGR